MKVLSKNNFPKHEPGPWLSGAVGFLALGNVFRRDNVKEKRRLMGLAIASKRASSWPGRLILCDSHVLEKPLARRTPSSELQLRWMSQFSLIKRWRKCSEQITHLHNKYLRRAGYEQGTGNNDVAFCLFGTWAASTLSFSFLDRDL